MTSSVIPPPDYAPEEAALLRDIAEAEHTLGENLMLDDDDVKKLRPDLSRDDLLDLLEGLETLGAITVHKVLSDSGFAAVRLQPSGWLDIAPALGIDARGDVDRVLVLLAARGRSDLTPGTELIELVGDAYRARKVVDHLESLRLVINSRIVGGVRNHHVALTAAGRRAAKAAKSLPVVAPAQPKTVLIPEAVGGDVKSESQRIFVSYSHDDEDHRERVLTLATDLRSAGIDVWFDRYETAPSLGWPRWMAAQIRDARFVLVICTATYCERAEGRNQPGRGGGANCEGSTIYQELYEGNGRNEKFIPILFEAATAPDDVPEFLRPYQRYRWPAQREELLRHMTGQPEIVAPPLGQKPVLPQRVLQAPGPIVEAPSSSSPGSFASELIDGLDTLPSAPWREVVVTPLTGARPIFRPADFLELVRHSAPELDVARDVLFPNLSKDPSRRTKGLVWREPPELLPSVMAVGLDGSLVLRTTLWEALRASHPPIWGTDGVGVGSCVELLVATIAFCDRLFVHALERRPYRIDLILAG